MFSIYYSKLKKNKNLLRVTNSIVKLLFSQLFIFNNRKQELIIVQGSFDKNSSNIVSKVFPLKLWWTELKSELKVCQFQNGLQLKNYKKKSLKNIKIKQRFIKNWMFSMLPINREFEYCFLLWNQMIAENKREVEN